MEHHFDDGTEPTIMPHMQCRGPGCVQGRKPCPHPDLCQPEAAEPCTELGAEDQGKCRTTFWWLYAAAMVGVGALVVSCIGR